MRLFSTSEDHYNIARPHDNASSFGAPVDFPSTCEIKLNQIPLTANTKGIKKKVGTAPPVSLSIAALNPNGVNKVEIVYVSTEKKYYVNAFVVEVTTVKQVVDKIKKGKYRSKEDVVASSQFPSLPLAPVRRPNPLKTDLQSSSRTRTRTSSRPRTASRLRTRSSARASRRRSARASAPTSAASTPRSTS